MNSVLIIRLGAVRVDIFAQRRRRSLFSIIAINLLTRDAEMINCNDFRRADSIVFNEPKMSVFRTILRLNDRRRICRGKKT